MEKIKVESNRLQSFLYTLARDHMTLGEIEKIMKNHVEIIDKPKTIFSNSYLANYAIDLADRLRRIDV